MGLASLWLAPLALAAGKGTHLILLQRNLPEPGERYRLLQHNAQISKLRARVQASLTDFHDAREAYFLERMAKEEQVG